MRPEFDVTIIGGGVIGSAIARELSKYKLKAALIDKEGDVAEGISKANSGVMHAGFNVKPGSLKARFNVQGLQMFPDLCRELGVEFKRCTKLVIAKDEQEHRYLLKLLEQGRQNSCSGLSLLDAAAIERLAPGVSGRTALYSQATGIVNPYQFTIALAENAHQNGVQVFLNTRLVNIERTITDARPAYFTIDTEGRSFTSKIVINAAGNHSDVVARMADPEFPLRLYPCRGEYHILDKEYSQLLRMAIYPVPPQDGSGLGVHLTPTMNGNILIGPSTEYIQGREDSATTEGTMQLLLNEACKLMPALKGAQVIRSYAGIRPKLFHPSTGISFADFHIDESASLPGMINLVGIESPGLTASPAIADYVRDRFIAPRLELIPKDDFALRSPDFRRREFLPLAQRRRLAETDRDFAEIICRCEGVSRAEVIRAIENPLGVRTLNGIKKRTHSMMGRCQGGFCMARVAEIMQARCGSKPDEIRQNGPESVICSAGKL
ncbi:MAG: NAD(P)/FAD-dependent oxidoreductase [Spirochaetota bacterium]